MEPSFYLEFFSFFTLASLVTVDCLLLDSVARNAFLDSLAGTARLNRRDALLGIRAFRRVAILFAPMAA